MIPRYVRKEMGEIWSEQNKFQKWLEVELAVLEAQAYYGDIPRQAYEHIRQNATFSVERIEEIDRLIEHDMNAFIQNVQEHLDPKYVGLFHEKTTSYDTEEPATALRFVESINIVINDILGLMSALWNRAKEHKWAVMAGRTHCQQAEPVTFGVKLLVWHHALERDLKFLEYAKEAVRCGKISGAVGVYGDLDPRVEERACEKLGLRPAKVSTQILQRDRHAQVMSALAITGATIEQIAVGLRLLSQTELQEVREPFREKQKGSSRMPHKKNPILLERLTGLARILRANLSVAIENIATWEERDISQSGPERIIFPDSFQLLDYMLNKLTWIIEKMEVFPDNMLSNLEKSYGTMASGAIKGLLLERGLEPEFVYRFLQSCSFRAVNEKRKLKVIILEERSDLFSNCEEMEKLEKCFDWKNQLKHMDKIFSRFGI